MAAVFRSTSSCERLVFSGYWQLPDTLLVVWHHTDDDNSEGDATVCPPPQRRQRRSEQGYAHHYDDDDHQQTYTLLTVNLHTFGQLIQVNGVCQVVSCS